MAHKPSVFRPGAAGCRAAHVWVAERRADGGFHDRHALALLRDRRPRRQKHGFDGHGRPAAHHALENLRAAAGGRRRQRSQAACRGVRGSPAAAAAAAWGRPGRGEPGSRRRVRRGGWGGVAAGARPTPAEGRVLGGPRPTPTPILDLVVQITPRATHLAERTLADELLQHDLVRRRRHHVAGRAAEAAAPREQLPSLLDALCGAERSRRAQREGVGARAAGGRLRAARSCA